MCYEIDRIDVVNEQLIELKCSTIRRVTNEVTDFICSNTVDHIIDGKLTTAKWKMIFVWIYFFLTFSFWNFIWNRYAVTKESLELIYSMLHSEMDYDFILSLLLLFITRMWSTLHRTSMRWCDFLTLVIMHFQFSIVNLANRHSPSSGNRMCFSTFKWWNYLIFVNDF